MKTYEGPAKVRIVCRGAECPNDLSACDPAVCLSCKHHELMVLDRGNVVGKGLLADRLAPEPKPEPEPVTQEKEPEASVE